MSADSTIIRAWIEALRSGKYRQGQGQLRDSDKFCCLGVLCDLHALEGLGYWNGDKYCIGAGHYPEEQFLPEDVWKWAGLPDENPAVRLPGINGEIQLSWLNDGEGIIGMEFPTEPMPFEAIADLLEATHLTVMVG